MGVVGHGGRGLGAEGGDCRQPPASASRPPWPPTLAAIVQRIVVLASGRGSNLRALVQACAAERWQARFVGVVSDRPQAEALAFAQAQGIATRVVDRGGHADRDSFDAALAAEVDALAPDLVLLAGFMRILPAAFVLRHAGRLLNVHPSLLPLFPGLHTHRRALEAGCKVAGATVHFVTPELDHGPIVAQAVVPVLAGDSEQTLAARVLEREHVLYPLAVRWWLDGELALEGGVVEHRRGLPQALL
jgi:phosphoribosylglycinamide formyltransferase-1